jgi:hypothetical protein
MTSKEIIEICNLSLNKDHQFETLPINIQSRFLSAKDKEELFHFIDDYFNECTEEYLKTLEIHINREVIKFTDLQNKIAHHFTLRN